jgi:RimJ/RimL family protein N-acetyltransferase
MIAIVRSGACLLHESAIDDNPVAIRPITLKEPLEVYLMESLTTERLILRKWQESDFAAVHDYAKVMENVRFMPFGPNTEEETKAFLTRSIARYADDPMIDYTYAVTLRETGQVIGGCSLTILRNQEASLGWILHRDHWKKGYGTELAGALIRFGFAELKLHRIIASCIADNYGSYRVMENSHMRREAHFIKNRFQRGEWQDEFIYALLQEEWEMMK